MCGISGFISKKMDIDGLSLIKSMTDAVSHRGPDDEGLFQCGRVALGHRRLSIIDLSADGHQPMHFNGGQDYVIVYNGEVYNYVELRVELTALGYEFTSHTDTEVILSAYVEWGDACVTRFNGMWAFAIYDRARQRVFCSRDRFGVKPFYYVDDVGRFAFGSEIRQLLPLLTHVKANEALLQDFIITSAADHTDGTFFQDVNKLPAGHNLVLDLASGGFAIERYYELRQRDEYTALDDMEAVSLYRQRLVDAVAIRLRSDVPVATCLSGGLDSSAIATVASQMYAAQGSGSFRAITAISEQSSNDESSYAQKVVENSSLAWVKVKPSYEDFVATLEDVVVAQEEPFTSPSLTMQYFVMQAARRNGIPVLLDGQAQDELCLGYEKYYASHFLTTYKRHGLQATLRAMFNAWKNNSNMGPHRMAMYLVGGLFSGLRYRFYRHRHAYMKARSSVPEHLTNFSKACADEFKVQKLEVTSTNLPLLLRYEDKNSMHHGVEARLPFLDYRFAETVLSMPGALKIRDGWTKWLVRRAMDGLMPDAITWRKNKLGFEAPEDMWLARHQDDMQKVVLSCDLLKTVCDMGKLARRYHRLDKRSRWRLYSVALWARSFGVSE
ncbi:asparagine synthase (glutamine-hydrolyzing) [Pseudomonas sp. TE50-2]|uniref:asparagine synthase (glutamine-hydrolyzing) n=1 Tax=Pseudomonas sp. TE50-2 TaxID=3142707 RepID=UPI003467250A